MALSVYKNKANIVFTAIQDRFNKANVIYKITRDLDLNGGTLVIPANCTLDFQGGVISNGTITLNNTYLKGIIILQSGITATVTGTYSKGQILWDDTQKKLQVYDGTKWSEVDLGVIFRWSDDNKIQISYDEGVTWEDLSPEFTNNFKIKGYVADISSLPSGAADGDMYMVGPVGGTGTTYNLYIKTTSGWVDNGTFTSISAGVLQELGDSTTNVMSQAAVTTSLDKHTLAHRMELNNTHDLNNIKVIGVYTYLGSNLPVNVPENISATLIVYPFFEEGTTYANQRIVQQVITVNGVVYYRYARSTEWSGWNKMADQSDISNTFSNRAVLSASDNLNNATSIGIYIWNSNAVPANSPTGASGGIMTVFPYYKSGQTQLLVQQVFIASGTTYIRYRTNVTWGEWRKSITENDVQILTRQDTLAYRTTLTSTDNVDDLTHIGIYSWISSQAPINKPFEGGGTIVVFPAFRTDVGETSRIIQMAMGSLGKVFFRYRTTGGWGSWIDTTFSGGSSGSSYEDRLMSAFLAKSFTTWTPEGNIPRNSENTSYYTGSITGLPYSSVFPFANDIYYHRGLSAFLSAIKNKGSVLYSKGYGGNTRRGSYYGTVCSSFTSYICGQKIYWETSEMFDVLEKINYVDIEQLNVGDVLLTTGHCKVISAVNTNSEGEYSITVTEQGGYSMSDMTYTKEGFEKILKGTDPHDPRVYILGRFKDQSIPVLPKIEYSENIISEFGDRTYFSLGDDVFITVKNGSQINISDGVDVTRHSLSDYPTKVVNNTTMYNIKSSLNKVGDYKIYTDSDTIQANIVIVNTGSAVVAGSVVNLNGYSDNLKPSWYSVIMLVPGTTDFPYYPAPDGYTGHQAPLCKGIVNSNNFEVTLSDAVTNSSGYYVRCYYDTKFGITYKDTNIIMLK